MSHRSGSRRAGILVPLFSFPSSRSWGIGEIGDIEPITRWLKRAGHSVLQLLPITEMPPGESSPYGALSAMAIDPQFITLADLEDFSEVGGEQALDTDARGRLEWARRAPRIDYATLRPLKLDALRRAFAHFHAREWRSGTRRSAAFRVYIDQQRWWLDDYALFRALHAEHGETPWAMWPEPLRQRDPHALAEARGRLADAILFRQYMQWIANDQWSAARNRAGDVALFGDLPFMVGGDSADVWSRQHEFRLDGSIGVPPDAFSETGQDWGLPVYRWDVIEEGGFDWLRARARRHVDLYDGYRVDHLVGFYRTFYRVHDTGETAFSPVGESDQLALGERVLGVLRESGAEIVVEDLGTVPDFVRESVARLGLPGYKVLRWEREWHRDNQPFKDPRTYPPVSMATSGTHDTESLRVWWETAPREERQAVLSIPSLLEHLVDGDVAEALAHPTMSPSMHEALLLTLYASGSNLLSLPIQDIFGWTERINQPATVSDWNWTWRLPWPADRMSMEPLAMERAKQLKAWCERYNR